MVHCLIFFTY